MPKRIFRLFCCVIILLSLIACSNDTKVGKGLLKMGPRPKRVTLTIYLPQQGINYPIPYEYQLKKVIAKELEKLALSKLNVNLEFGNVKKVRTKDDKEYTMVDNVIELAIKAGFPCDIYFTKADILPFLEEKGNVKDITTLFPRHAPEYFSLFRPEELENVTYNDKLLGIPSRTLPVTKRLCAVVRDDLAKKYIKEDIRNFNDFEKFLKSVKQNESKYSPLLFQNTTLELFAEYYGYQAFNPQPYASMGLVYKRSDPACKLLSWEQTSEYMQAVNKIKMWRSMGYYKDPGVVIDYDALSGRYASFIAENGSAYKFNKALKNNGIDKWKYREYDLYSGEKSLKTFDPGNIACISPNSKNPERAVMFIEWLMSNSKAYDVLKFGIEDKDFKFKKDGTISPLVPEGTSKEYAFMKSQSNWCINNINFDHLDKDYLNTRLKYLKQYT